MAETSNTPASVPEVRDLIIWINASLDRRYRGLQSAAEACLSVTDMFRRTFPTVQIAKDLWISNDFYEWCMTIVFPDGRTIEISDQVGNGHQ